MAMVDYGQDAPAMDPDDELRAVRADYARLLEHHGKMRAEMIGLLRDECKRLNHELEQMGELRQRVLADRPNTNSPGVMPAEMADEMAMLMRQKEALARQYGSPMGGVRW